MTPTIIDFITDPQLLGLSLSPAQETLLRAAYGLPLESRQAELYRERSGRVALPAHGFSDVAIVAGVRAGKDSRIAAPVVLYEALFGRHERHLARGERAVIPLVAQDREATRIAFGYIAGHVKESVLIASMVEEVLAGEIRLTNRTSVLCFACTMKSLCGWSIPCGVLHELAFFRLEGAADSDAEIQASIRRGMLRFSSPRLVKISTPYMRSGVLWEDFKAAFGQDDPDGLVWRAPSVLMNPSLKAERLERERRLGPSRFAREYEAEFGEDLETFLPAAWVDDAVQPGRHELPPIDGALYIAACDPSGGGADAFTLALVHVEGEGDSRRTVQDVMRSWGKRTGGEGAVKEIADILKRYRLSTVSGDRYAGAWVREAFQRQGVQYMEAQMTKAEAYLEAEPLFAQGRVALLDHPQLVRELKTLERRPRAGGRDLVDHPRGRHDDHANALCLASVLAMQGSASGLNAMPVEIEKLLFDDRWAVPMDW